MPAGDTCLSESKASSVPFCSLVLIRSYCFLRRKEQAVIVAMCCILQQMMHYELLLHQSWNRFILRNKVLRFMPSSSAALLR